MALIVHPCLVWTFRDMPALVWTPVPDSHVVRAPPSCCSVHKLFLVNSSLLCLYAGANGNFTVACAPHLTSVTSQEFSLPSGTHRQAVNTRTLRVRTVWSISTLGWKCAGVEMCHQAALAGATNVNVGVDTEKVKFYSPRQEGYLPLKLPHIFRVGTVCSPTSCQHFWLFFKNVAPLILSFYLAYIYLSTHSLHGFCLEW